jgi:hypothetical protein
VTSSPALFPTWLRERMSDADHGPPFPDEGLVYDYKLVYKINYFNYEDKVMQHK